MLNHNLNNLNLTIKPNVPGPESITQFQIAMMKTMMMMIIVKVIVIILSNYYYALIISRPPEVMHFIFLAVSVCTRKHLTSFHYTIDKFCLVKFGKEYL
jgi:hypothetical protein